MNPWCRWCKTRRGYKACRAGWVNTARCRTCGAIVGYYLVEHFS